MIPPLCNRCGHENLGNPKMGSWARKGWETLPWRFSSYITYVAVWHQPVKVGMPWLLCELCRQLETCWKTVNGECEIPPSGWLCPTACGVMWLCQQFLCSWSKHRQEQSVFAYNCWGNAYICESLLCHQLFIFKIFIFKKLCFALLFLVGVLLITTSKRLKVNFKLKLLILNGCIHLFCVWRRKIIEYCFIY